MSKESAEASDSQDAQETEPLVLAMESEQRPSELNAKVFMGILAAAEAVGILAIILVIVWVTSHLGGFGWENPFIQFNYHPVFMVIGMVFIFGNSILTYRGLREQRKSFLKLLHGGLNALVLLLALFASYSVFDFHNRANIPNLYSLHSWCGFLTLTVFALQLVGGFVAFLYPGLAPYYRKMILPYHVFGGLGLFLLACATCLTGITEKAFFSLNGKQKPAYATLPSEAFVLNFLGLAIVVFAFLVTYLATREEYKRKPLPEEQQLSGDVGMASR